MNMHNKCSRVKQGGWCLIRLMGNWRTDANSKAGQLNFWCITHSSCASAVSAGIVYQRKVAVLFQGCWWVPSGISG